MLVQTVQRTTKRRADGALLRLDNVLGVTWAVRCGVAATDQKQHTNQDCAAASGHESHGNRRLRDHCATPSVCARVCGCASCVRVCLRMRQVVRVVDTVSTPPKLTKNREGRFAISHSFVSRCITEKASAACRSP